MSSHDTSKYPLPPPAYTEHPPLPSSEPVGMPYQGSAPYPSYAGDAYPPPPAPTQMHTIAVVAPLKPLGTKSAFVVCPQCRAQMWTRVETKPNMMTHTCALILCCFILWPIAWLPYCCDACQTSVHFCSQCNSFVGEHAP